MSKSNSFSCSHGNFTPKQNKKRSRKTSSHKTQLLIEQDKEELLHQTRAYLYENESKNIRSRYKAFQETLDRLRHRHASYGPEYTKHSLSNEDVHACVEWVNNFKGVIVKRRFLDTGTKKGKGWADQHRAKFLGENFFPTLLGQLSSFVDFFHPHISRPMSRQEFLYTCLILLIKRTYSPKHKQAGDTLLICDQALKGGETREYLEQMLRPLDLSQCKKGRDIVELLENTLNNDINDDDAADVNARRRIQEEDIEMKDQESDGNLSSSSSSIPDLPPERSVVSTNCVPPKISSRLKINEQRESPSATGTDFDPPPHVVHNQQNLTVPICSQVDWQTFPPNVSIQTIPTFQQFDEVKFLRYENMRLKTELANMRKQLVIQDMNEEMNQYYAVNPTYSTVEGTANGGTMVGVLTGGNFAVSPVPAQY